MGAPKMTACTWVRERWPGGCLTHPFSQHTGAGYLGFLEDWLSGVSGSSRSNPFLGMRASDSRFRIVGMDIFIAFFFRNLYGKGIFHFLLVPKFRRCVFFIPFPIPDCGSGFISSLPDLDVAISQAGIISESDSLILLPAIPGNNSLWFLFPNCGNAFFFHSLPVSELWE